jgi:hypothetical protein
MAWARSAANEQPTYRVGPGTDTPPPRCLFEARVGGFPGGDAPNRDHPHRVLRRRTIACAVAIDRRTCSRSKGPRLRHRARVTALTRRGCSGSARSRQSVAVNSWVVVRATEAIVAILPISRVGAEFAMAQALHHAVNDSPLVARRARLRRDRSDRSVTVYRRCGRWRTRPKRGGDSDGRNDLGR